MTSCTRLHRKLAVLATGIALGLGGGFAAMPAYAKDAQPTSAKAKAPGTAKGSDSVKKAASKSRSTVRAKPAVASRSVQSKKRNVKPVVHVPARPSYGQLAGLHSAQDELALKSAVALVIDQDTKEVLFRKNDTAVLPIASLTKLMTAYVVSEAQLDMNAPITITEADIDTEKGSRSRLQIGTTLTRAELMHLSLMSSENRAAHALGRTFPGGMSVFVALMNAKATQIGMKETTFVEPTGLSSKNQSSARDLASLVAATSKVPELREWSVSQGAQVPVGPQGTRTVSYMNTNRLTANPNWDILLQKTGYISEAGQCLVMQTKVAGRKLVMVFLDSFGKYSRLGDAERVRAWVEAQHALPVNPRS